MTHFDARDVGDRVERARLENSRFDSEITYTLAFG